MALSIATLMRVDDISLEKKHWGLLRICRLEANRKELGRWMVVASTVGWRKGAGGKGDMGVYRMDMAVGRDKDELHARGCGRGRN